MLVTHRRAQIPMTSGPEGTLANACIIANSSNSCVTRIDEIEAFFGAICGSEKFSRRTVACVARATAAQARISACAAVTSAPIRWQSKASGTSGVRTNHRLRRASCRRRLFLRATTSRPSRAIRPTTFRWCARLRWASPRSANWFDCSGGCCRSGPRNRASSSAPSMPAWRTSPMRPVFATPSSAAAASCRHSDGMSGRNCRVATCLGSCMRPPVSCWHSLRCGIAGSTTDR